MKGIPHEDRIIDLVLLIKTLHIVAIEAVTDDDLKVAIAHYKQDIFSRRVRNFDDATIFQLLKAFKAFRECLPIEPGDSPFEYRK